MGVVLKRKKRRNFKLSLAYKIGKLLPISQKNKLKLYLDLAWIFNRLAHEQTFSVDISIEDNPENDFLLNKILQEMSILDIGCGTGHVIRKLMPKTKNIIGVDYDSSSIEKAQKTFIGTDIKLFCDDIFSYFNDYPNKKFDVIIMSHLLEHIDYPKEFLQQIANKAKYFYVEVPDFETTHLNLYRKAIDTDLVYTDADHIFEFDRKELEELINNSKLKILDKNYSFGVMRYWLQANS